LSVEDAEIRCLGEAAERLSVLSYGDDLITAIAPAEISPDLLALLGEVEGPVPCLSGQRLSDGDAVWVPASLCLHDPSGLAPAVAKGSAAGATWQDAFERATAELIERDATALWRRGGQMPAPVALDVLAETAAGHVLKSLREGASTRTTWLLGISTEFGLAVIAAVSVMQNGEGFACGLAAAPAASEAVSSALVEMAQMELSQHLIRGKAQALGQDGLTEADFRQIERSVWITPQSCPLIVTSGVPKPISPRCAPDEISTRLNKVSPLYVVEVTRPAINIPVAVVIAPGLNSMAAGHDTARLQAVVDQTGGGDQHHGGVGLL
jgi:ribosomal protein S12 methylthiotransferase accessory factor YcaO